jgi:2-amino-4-hydroxy-6-hydroxymethyldihydropteridine diphosphokinase
MENKFSNIAYLGIGSNVGVQINNIDNAVEMIDQNPACKVEKVSSIYETSPYGVVEQAEFFNAVIKVATELEPKELFQFLKSVENKVGRNITKKWGPREIDLDIIFYNDMIYTDEQITIPHKDLLNRDFVLVPLMEIEPELIHPEYNKKISEISIFKRESEQTFAKTIKSNIIRKIPHQILIK